jgi:diaminohydroxyphosphoribosylaminopyrimidine deaminase/5-amino-6-(5-phosphoribosylamino)uracil reductase
MEKEEYYLYQALIESRKAQAISSPNPSVGAIIVKNGRIIGKGWTQFYGGPHAEVMAFKNCNEDPSGATLYVTLEPCSHYGKTPPCTDLIISKKIKKVVIGIEDPNPIVCGNGIKKLKSAGIEVKTGILKEKIEKELQWYIKYIKKSIPYVTLKSGISLDGKITDFTGNSKWITSKLALKFSQKLREINDGIIVGINTILSDNPFLTYRGKVKKFFYRIVLDTFLKIPINANVIREIKNHKTIIATSRFADEEKIKKLRQMGVDVILTEKVNEGKIDLNELLKYLGKLGIAKVIVEGGSEVNFSFIENKLVDKIFLFISPKILGGKESKSFIGGRGLKLKNSLKIIDGKYYNYILDNFIFEGYIKYYKI